MNDKEIGHLESQVSTLVDEVKELRTEVKTINARLDQGAGGVKVLLWASGIITALLAGAAWFGQHFKPFG